jgi:hypothetical protein
MTPRLNNLHQLDCCYVVTDFVQSFLGLVQRIVIAHCKQTILVDNTT